MQLSEQCVLATLKISMFSGEITDKQTTAELCLSKNTQTGQAKVRKLIFPKAALAGVKAAASKARASFKLLTFPWLVDGTGLLPSKNYLTLIEEMAERKREMMMEKDKFVSSVERFKEIQKGKLGSMFHESDYPSDMRIDSEFEFEINIAPLADPNDFRIKLQESDRLELISQAEKKAQAMIDNATKQLASRLLEPLEKLVNTLANKDKKFEYTTIANVFKIIDLIPQMNLADDPELKKAEQDLRACLNSCVGLSELLDSEGDTVNTRAISKALRTDEQLREEKTKETDAILKRLKDCGF